MIAGERWRQKHQTELDEVGRHAALGAVVIQGISEVKSTKSSFVALRRDIWPNGLPRNATAWLLLQVTVETVLV